MLSKLLVLVLLATDPPPSISLPASVKGKSGKFITVAATTQGNAVKWYSPDGDHLDLFPADLLKDSKTAVVIADAPGTYRLLAITSVDNAPAVSNECAIVVDDGVAPVPAPTPQPDPGPGPQPSPVAKQKLIVTAWARESTLTPAQAAVLSNLDLRTTITNAGNDLNLVNVDVAEKDQAGSAKIKTFKDPSRIAKWPQLGQIGTSPVLTIQDAKGKMLAVMAMPETTDGFRAEVKKQGGL